MKCAASILQCAATPQALTFTATPFSILKGTSAVLLGEMTTELAPVKAKRICWESVTRLNCNVI